MAYWLFKSEPGTWSWDDQVKCGAKGTEWDGVRNYMANNFMKDMKIGDKGFFYHSVNEKQVVGIVEVIGEHVMDPTDAKGKFGMVDVAPVMPVICTMLDSISVESATSVWSVKLNAPGASSIVVTDQLSLTPSMVRSAAETVLPLRLLVSRSWTYWSFWIVPAPAVQSCKTPEHGASEQVRYSGLPSPAIVTGAAQRA